ncbi:MAG: galactose mutarotase [Microbacteriaceae bacterium]|jgi:aldose 1-epimerase|nr:galactose mutarotase [Microbacteriaceae bacterium]MCI1207568.1 galactose mutarotase [Microbacteriaceae bacterium]
MTEHMLGGGPEGNTLRASAHGYTVTAHTRGASLASLVGPGGWNLVVPTPPEGRRIADSGATLAPWPNRLEDGEYVYQGDRHRAPLDEPERSNALHGLVRNILWEPLPSPDTEIRLTTLLTAVEPYPFPIRLTSRFRPDAHGLHWSLTAQNLGRTSAPYAAALHPYLVAADWTPERRPASDGWMLLLPATARLTVDPDRLLPTGVAPLEDAGLLDATHPIGDRSIDSAYTGFPGSPVSGRLIDSDGRGAQITFRTRWAQVYTDDSDGRRGVAVEPQTAPANALRGHPDLIELRPGQCHTLSCTLSQIG